jgi:high-affinity Fe2+/Pb2+ permease
MARKVFIALCIAAPVAFALVRPIFPHSTSVAAVFAVTGLVLAVVLLAWSIRKLFSDRRHVSFGFASVFVCFCFLVVVADYFAAHEQRQRQSSGTNVSRFSK